jgi:hypothetical protein
VKRLAKIILKECPDRSWKSVCALDDRVFAAAWGGPYIGSPYGIQIRTLDGLVEEIADCAAPLVRAGTYLLSEGALCGGYSASTRVLEDQRLVVELPVTHPYVLSSQGVLFARIRSHYGFGSPIIEPERAAPFPELKNLIDAGSGVLVACDLAGRVQLTISEKELAAPYAELTGLALSPDENTLFYSGYRSVGAIDLSRREILWVKHFAEVWHRRLALSADGTRLAVGGMGPVRVFDPAGELVKELHCFGRIDALAYDGRTLMAAGNGKTLFLFDENHQAREMKVAAAGINGLAVIAGGVVIACDQRQLRFVPLLDGEQ